VSEVPDPGGSVGPGAASLVEVGDGVHAWVQPDGTWWVNNTGVVVGPDELLVVDTCATAERTGRFLEAVERLSPLPVTRAVNTHQHGDHTYGNSLLPRTTTLIGHELMRDGLAADPVIDGCPPFWEPVPDWGEVERRLPDVTIADSAVVHLGSRAVGIHHPGRPAHTAGDLAVTVPDAGVLFAGDLVFAGLTPLVFMGSVAGALEALDWLEAFGAEVVVPGHGPVLRGQQIASVLDAHRRYYAFVLQLADDGLRRGVSPLDAARGGDLGEFASWPDPERIVPNVHRGYADRAGTEVDPVHALADAVRWLGRPMSTSV
jgi:cyclase